MVVLVILIVIITIIAVAVQQTKQSERENQEKDLMSEQVAPEQTESEPKQIEPEQPNYINDERIIININTDKIVDEINNYVRESLEQYCDEPFFPALFCRFSPEEVVYRSDNLSPAGSELYCANIELKTAAIEAQLAQAKGLKTADKKVEKYYTCKKKLETLVERYRNTKFLIINDTVEDT